MNSDTFCVLPWIHLATHPHGGTTVCCVSDHRHSNNRSFDYVEGSEKTPNDRIFRSVGSDPIEKVMNNYNFNNIRLKLLNGEEPSVCTRCYAEERAGMVSKRYKENADYSDFTFEDAVANTNEDGSLKKIDLKFVELRMGNICNLKCRTCNPWSSSKWVSDWKKLDGNSGFTINHDDFKWPTSERFWDDLLESAKDASTFYINGGEPTLVEEHFVFLEKLVTSGKSTEVKLWYNLNMTGIPERLVSLWKNFKNVHISMSIDDIGERNDFLRTSNWKTTVKNVDKLLANEFLSVDLNQTISWLNFPYLDEYRAWATTLRGGLHVNMNFVYDPSYYSVNVLPLDFRVSTIKGFTTISEDDRSYLMQLFGTKEPNPADIEKAKSVTAQLDAIRRESVQDAFSKLEGIMFDK